MVATAAQLEELNEEDLEEKLDGILFLMNAKSPETGEILNEDLYEDQKRIWDALVEAENWVGLEGILQNFADAQELESTEVATQGKRRSVITDSGEEVFLGVQQTPLEVATETLEGADRALLGGITKPRDYLSSDFYEWLHGISEGDKDRLAQALFVQGYYDSMGITDLDDINDPTYFAHAIQGALAHAEVAAETFGADVGMAAVPTLQRGGRFAGTTEEDFEEAKREFLRDSGPTYYPTSYLKTTGQQVARETLGRNFNRRELQQYVLMANKLLDDQSDPARLRNEQIDLGGAGVEFATALDEDAARANQIGDLMSTVDKVLGL